MKKILVISSIILGGILFGQNSEVKITVKQVQKEFKYKKYSPEILKKFVNQISEVEQIPIVTEFIPKVQTRKLHQAANDQLEAFKELTRQQGLEGTRAAATAVNIPLTENVFDLVIEDAEVIQEQVIEEIEDETTLKLRKLKSLYDKQLITQAEYESKKANILDSL